MDVPHLHFNVFRIIDGKGVSIPFKFSDSKTITRNDVLNNSFYSELEQELGVKGKDMDVIPNNVIALPSYKENVFEKYRMAA